MHQKGLLVSNQGNNEIVGVNLCGSLFHLYGDYLFISGEALCFLLSSFFPSVQLHFLHLLSLVPSWQPPLPYTTSLKVRIRLLNLSISLENVWLNPCRHPTATTL